MPTIKKLIRKYYSFAALFYNISLQIYWNCDYRATFEKKWLSYDRKKWGFSTIIATR